MRRRTRALLVAAALTPALLLPAGPAHAAQVAAPNAAATPEQWVVSLGDSYISGEAGRWAGNTDRSPARIDALGPTAYDDNPADNGELIPLCHRSKSAEIHIGDGVGSVNLACSGAKTTTFTTDDGTFKPGLDFYKSGGRMGQALMLEEFAKTHHVTMVAVSIGGNDFGFGDIVTACVKDFLESNWFRSYYCKDDASVREHLTAANVDRITNKIAAALRNVREAMALAGYADSSYKILVQNYPAPLPHGSAIRYPQSGYTRQSVGGCGLWNADVDWALGSALPKISTAVFTAATRSGLPNVVRMDLSGAFDGRRLCQNTVGLLEEKNLPSWRDANAVNRSEWIDQIRIATLGTPYFQQESLHPNFWGQLAMRDCLRQAYDHGVIRGGKCTIAGQGLNGFGEPKMKLS